MKNKFKILIPVVILIFSILFWIEFGINFDKLELKSLWSLISETSTITIFLYMIFNKWIWKWKIIRNFHKVPVLKQTYKAKLSSSYQNTNINITLKINQTFENISINVKTEQSKSYSILSEIRKEKNSTYLYYLYESEPDAISRNKGNNKNSGTAILEILENGHLSGNYYNDRKRIGTIKTYD